MFRLERSGKRSERRADQKAAPKQRLIGKRAKGYVLTSAQSIKNTRPDGRLSWRRMRNCLEATWKARRTTNFRNGCVVLDPRLFYGLLKHFWPCGDGCGARRCVRERPGAVR